MNIYFISGLGADQRVFQFLDLPDVNKIFIQWVVPQQNETIRHYASRLISQIDISQPVFLIGISFGGVIAQEIASLIHCQKVIIISSIKSPREFSLPLTLVRWTKIHLLIPPKLLKWSNHVTADYYFGVQSTEESKLLHQIIEDTDSQFSVWAIKQLMQWKPVQTPTAVLHIHGAKDRIFPVYPIKNARIIENGGHFMIINMAPKISSLIKEQILAMKQPGI